jgi:hypothetical protein
VGPRVRIRFPPAESRVRTYFLDLSELIKMARCLLGVDKMLRKPGEVAAFRPIDHLPGNRV